jgi:hypothetical protein
MKRDPGNRYFATQRSNTMHTTHDTPTMYEWVALIQQDAAQAKQLLIALKVRIKREGLMADPSLEISVEDYQRAQNLLASAAGDAEKTSQVHSMARLGQATFGPYPDRHSWLRMIDEDPIFADRIWGELRAKQALFGPGTPRAVLESIAAYRAAKAELQAKAGE